MSRSFTPSWSFLCQVVTRPIFNIQVCGWWWISLPIHHIRRVGLECPPCSVVTVFLSTTVIPNPFHWWWVSVQWSRLWFYSCTSSVAPELVAVLLSPQLALEWNLWSPNSGSTPGRHFASMCGPWTKIMSVPKERPPGGRWPLTRWSNPLRWTELGLLATGPPD